MLSRHPRSCHHGVLGAALGGNAPFACRQCGVFHMGGGLGAWTKPVRSQKLPYPYCIFIEGMERAVK